ncbi:MAG: glycosyltransferase family 117 protein [Anaerolineales bacterium]
MNDRYKRIAPLFRTDILFAVLIGLSALALYIRTLAPSLLWGDSAEFQTLSYTLGMTHPSGYMTQIMLGKLFTYLPVGNIAYRVNLMSAFFGALAVTQVYLIVRMLGGLPIAGISASMMLALSQLFWRRALVAESYTIAASMLATIWLLFLFWRHTQKWGYLFAAGLAGGLSMGIHSTVLMTTISVLIIMVMTTRKRADWIGAAAGALLGIGLTFSFFLYLDHHDPPSSIYNAVYRPSLSARGLTINDFDTPLERFSAIFPAEHFWAYYFTASPDEVSRRLIEYLSFHPVWAVILILIGVFASFNRSWRDGLYPLIAFLTVWGFALTVAFSVYQEFYTPAAIFVYVWFGLGASIILEQIFQKKQAGRRVLQIVASILLIALPLWQSRRDLNLAITNGYTTFVRRDHIYPIFAPDKAIRDAKGITNRIEDDAIVFADWDKLYSYIYTAHIEEGRTGIAFHEATITDDPALAQTTLAYIDANIDVRPIYFTVFMPELTDRYQVQQINNTLYRIHRK